MVGIRKDRIWSQTTFTDSFQSGGVTIYRFALPNLQLGDTIGHIRCRITMDLQVNASVLELLHSRIKYGLYVGTEANPTPNSPNIEGSAWMLWGQMNTYAQATINTGIGQANPLNWNVATNSVLEVSEGMRTVDATVLGPRVCIFEADMPNAAGAIHQVHVAIRYLILREITP